MKYFQDTRSGKWREPTRFLTGKMMFLKNCYVSLLRSVPLALRAVYDGANHTDVEFAVRTIGKEVKMLFFDVIAIFSMVFMLGLVIRPREDLVGPFVDLVILGIVLNVAYLLYEVYISPSRSLKTMRKFARSWQALLGLLREWEIDEDNMYSWEKVDFGTFVRKNMVSLASRISDAEFFERVSSSSPFLPKKGAQSAGYQEFATELRARLNCHFDILRQFGLAYGNVETYFELEASRYDVAD